MHMDYGIQELDHFWKEENTRKAKENVCEKWFHLKKSCYGVQNFLPDLPEGEDPNTWEKYQQEMKNQLSLCKEKRNKELLCTLMDKTFPHWRHLIVKEIIHLQDLMEMYSMLSTEDQVVNSVKLVFCYCLFRFVSSVQIL